jgi:hypothetical protein
MVSMTEGQRLALFVLLAIVIDAEWGALARLGPWAVLALFALLTTLAWDRADEPRTEFDPRRALPSGRMSREGVAIGAVALLPTALYLAVTWNREYAFSGDNGYHVTHQLRSRAFWLPQLPAFFALAAALWAAARARLLRWAIPATLVLLWVWSYPMTLPGTFARFPGAGYFFALPVQIVAGFFRWDSPVNAVRLSNALALPAWLFLLRPLVVKRWPDLRILPFCLFFFWQKDVVYLFTSVYLEPWSVVLALLAVEHLLETEGARALDSCLIVGLAALVKEQAVFLLPFFWLAAEPWKLAGEGRRRALIVGLVSAVPFAYYILMRILVEVWRTARAATLSDILRPGRLSEFALHLRFEFHAPGLAALALGVAAVVFLLASRHRRRVKVLCLTAAAVFQLLFFYVDQDSLFWTGYARFQLLVWLLLGAALIVISDRLREGGRLKTRFFWLGTVALGVLNGSVFLPEAYRAWALPAPYRSFTLHFDDPRFFDIGSLVEKASADGALRGVSQLVLVDMTGDYAAGSWTTAYAKYSSLYALGTLRAKPPGSVADCRCRAPGQAFIVPFELRVGLRAVAGLRSTYPAQDAAFRDQCLTALRASCAAVVEDRFEGELLGVLGAR